jgi:hypothetical protein
VLYGALPPGHPARGHRQLHPRRLDVLVTTDVIGHGINVPATTVLFAETEKYDGTRRRPLLTWEAAQIAGRAGRFGLADSGSVGHLAGIAALKPDRRLIAAAVEVARGDAPSDLPQRTPRLRPVLDDLGAGTPFELVEGLQAWQAWAKRVTEPVGAAADDVAPLIERVTALLPSLRGPFARRRRRRPGVAARVAADRLRTTAVDALARPVAAGAAPPGGRPTSADQLLHEVDLGIRGTGAVEALGGRRSAARGRPGAAAPGQAWPG